MSSIILGISAYYHDSAAALLKDGKIVAAAQEERFTRIKHDASFPSNAIKACLSAYREQYGVPLPLSEIDAIVFYENPFLKFERLMETYCAYAPHGLKQFLTSMPIWMKEKMHPKKYITDELSRLEPGTHAFNLLCTEHHVAHAASAFFASPFQDAAILTVDGVGEWATATISRGQNTNIEIMKELHFPHSIGLLYSAFTYFLGFKVNSGEYKIMGLAPYGDPLSTQTNNFIKLIQSHLVTIKDDGSLWLHQEYFDYCVGLRMINEEKWEKLFGFPARKPESEITLNHCNAALAIQKVTEEIMLRLAREAKKTTNMSSLCLAGGVALNCVANGRLLRENIFDHIWIQPAAGDAGGALGAALAAQFIYLENPRMHSPADLMQGSFLGPQFGTDDIEYMARKYAAVYEQCEGAIFYAKVAQLLDEGNILGWFQGRMEFGPRALGNRSILADPRNPEMQKRVNLKIKYRESFRPFAPSVLEEDVALYFRNGHISPYMLLVDFVKKDRRHSVTDDYGHMTLSQKICHIRSDIPAITHLDYSARVHTVSKEDNITFYELLKAFKQRTGCSMLLNTSFNVRGEPIVCTPADAYDCFMRTEMDYLVINNLIFDKKKQTRLPTNIHNNYTFSSD